jgi:sigma-B regulation protein RsbU (phosphoserine phosphatase)
MNNIGTKIELDARSQLDCILHITEAINMNESVEHLLTMYLSYLIHNMDMKEAYIVLQTNNNWQKITLNTKTNTLTYTSYQGDRKNKEKQYGYYIIEVKHKETPIAYTHIIDPSYSEERFVFVNSITNIIAVAIENKRLFKKQIEQERYKKEIELASEVQKMLIPGKIPRSEHIEIATIYKPQLNIGGDYYDYIEKEPGIFVFCVADISGKGVGAALLMANFQATLRHAVYHHSQLEDIVVFLNHQLIATTNSERIITLFLGQYNSHTQYLEFVNAGHTPAFLVNNDTIQILKEGTTLLGAFDELPPIKKGKTKITGEAILMAYTDGLTDLQNDAGVFFDEYCLKFFLLDHHKKDVDTIIQSLFAEMNKFKGRKDYPDDIAILVCKIKP